MPDHDLPRHSSEANRELDAILASSYQQAEEALRSGLDLEAGLSQIIGPERPAEASPLTDADIDMLRDRFVRFQHGQAQPMTTGHRISGVSRDRGHPHAAPFGSTATTAAAVAVLEAPERLSNPRSARPTVHRLVLGGHLRRLREQAGLTTDRAAASIRSSRSKISRIEHGRVSFKEQDIADLLTLYGVVEGAERGALLHLVHLAAETDALGWWRAYSDILPNWVEPYFGLEAAAAAIREFEVQFVPGLLQTEDYARAVIRLGNLLPEDEVMRRASVRISRQEILRRKDPPNFWAVLDESALRRHIGSPEIMRAQLRHLIDMCEYPNVRLQILPFTAGPHRAMGGPFTILRYNEPDLRDIVYIEQLTSALYLDKPTEVEAYLEVIEEVCILAETPTKTPRLLLRMLEEA